MAKHEEIPLHLKRGIVITLVAYFFSAISSALVSSFGENLPIIQIFTVSCFISLFCIAPITLQQGVKSLRTKFLHLHIIRDLFGAASTLLFFLAIRALNLVDATVLSYTSPFFVPLLWKIWRQEKIKPNVWWSILVGFFGIAIILNPSKEIFQLGFVYGLFSGISGAIALSSIRILNLEKEPMTRTIFYFFLFSGLTSFPFTWAVWVPFTGTDWFLCGIIGVFSVLAQILITVAYRYGTASYLSPLSYSVVIYNVVIAAFIYGQKIEIRSILGTLIIVAGGTITYVLKQKPSNLLETFENQEQKKTLEPPTPGSKPKKKL